MTVQHLFVLFNFLYCHRKQSQCEAPKKTPNPTLKETANPKWNAFLLRPSYTKRRWLSKTKKVPFLQRDALFHAQFIWGFGRILNGSKWCSCFIASSLWMGPFTPASQAGRFSHPHRAWQLLGKVRALHASAGFHLTLAAAVLMRQASNLHPCCPAAPF